MEASDTACLRLFSIASLAILFVISTSAQAQTDAHKTPQLAPEAPPFLEAPTLRDDRDGSAPDHESSRTIEQELANAFDDLALEDDEVRRKAEQKIAQIWSRSGSATADLILRRGRNAMRREEWDKALQHFNDLVNLAPEFAEGWNMRATLHFQQEDYGRSLADIAQTIALEPKHFGALSGLGLILEALGLETEAMKAFNAALKLHPNLQTAQDAIDRLRHKVDGRDA